MPKLDLSAIPQTNTTGYPAQYADVVQGRWYRRLAPTAGLSDFGASHVVLQPGAWSSQRHWHSHEDELVYVVEGELVMVTDAGEETLRAGDSAGWPAGARDGHHLQNRTAAVARFLVVGGRDDRDHGEYPDLDLKFLPGRYSGGGGYTHNDGTRY